MDRPFTLPRTSEIGARAPPPEAERLISLDQRGGPKGPSPEATETRKLDRRTSTLGLDAHSFEQEIPSCRERRDPPKKIVVDDAAPAPGRPRPMGPIATACTSDVQPLAGARLLNEEQCVAGDRQGLRPVLISSERPVLFHGRSTNRFVPVDSTERPQLDSVISQLPDDTPIDLGGCARPDGDWVFTQLPGAATIGKKLRSSQHLGPKASIQPQLNVGRYLTSVEEIVRRNPRGGALWPPILLFCPTASTIDAYYSDKQT